MGAEDALLGKQVEDFSLRDFHGNMHTLSQYADKKAVVLAFLGTECPLAKAVCSAAVRFVSRVRRSGRRVPGRGCQLARHAHQALSFRQTYKVEFPLLKDAGNVVVDRLGATRTPEVFVLDGKRVVRYHGRIDDQFLVGVQRGKATSRDLATALDELLAGKEVSKPSTQFTGCLIARAHKIEPKGEVTYSKHVAAIFNRHCVECHRDGELAPFPAGAYDEVVGWADNIREVVSEGRMPPWLADPQYGKFSNDCSMSAEEKETLFAWIDDGCPEGDPADLPAPPKFTTGWRMGEPDVVYPMPEAFNVPAEGTVDYQYFTVEPDVKEDMWVIVAEGRPGNPAVVHHVVLFAVPPGVKVSRPEEVQAWDR